MTPTEQELKELERLQRGFEHYAILKRAEERQKARKISVDGETHTYALLSAGLANPDEPKFKRYIELLEQNGVEGFCMWSLYGIDSLSFVVEKNVPPEFQDFVALHEIEEAVMLPVLHNSNRDHAYFAAKQGVEWKNPQDPYIEAHCWACRTELREVFSKGEDFTLKFIQWLSNGYFTNADPNFFANRDRSKINPLELILQLIDAISLNGRDTWIKEFSWLLNRT